MNRSAIALSFVLLGVPLPAQGTPADGADRIDAIHLLQGTTTDGRIDPDDIARVARWLGRVRAAHPEVATIHVTPKHELGKAIVSFDRLGKEQLEKAKWRSGSGGEEQQGKIGIPALDELQEQLGGKLVRWGFPPRMLFAHFPKDLDVIAVCRRYRALWAVEAAEPNAYGGLGGGHDDIWLHVRGDLLLLVFEQGGDGEAAPSRFRYYEIDTKDATMMRRGELAPEDVLTARVHRWNVPERFPAAAFADLDAVLQACRSAEWWTARHGVEVIGHLLGGAGQPMYGEDLEHRERFARIREQLGKRRREAWDAVLAGLGHGDPAVRASALRWLRQHSELEHGADADGRAAFRRWVEAQQR